MKKNVTTTAVTVPSAFISKRKQRVKQFNNIVYLQNGDEFEIELFNPTSNKVLAKIEINGNSIGGSGIVLRPGERVFLERYLNDSKKFLFETYKVSGSNSQVQQAIKNNGDVVVKFYNEYLPIYLTNINTYTRPIITLPKPWSNPYKDYYYTNGNSTTLNGSTNNTFYTASFTTNTSNYAGSLDLNTNRSFATTDNLLSEFANKNVEKTKEIETGRVEKGSNSDQSFTYDYSTFNTYHFAESSWKIMPASQKPITREDLAVFCTECGTKRKKESHKFCPICGTQY